MSTLHGFSDNKYEFLSNFYACDIPYTLDNGEKITFKTAEHAYQALKAISIDDIYYIANAPTPAAAKRRGRSIIIRPDWEEVKDDVMLKVLRIKFKNPEMQERILDTYNDGITLFSEDNWWHDNYWGVCQCPDCPGFGKNKLGKLLTQVREEVKNENEKGNT